MSSADDGGAATLAAWVAQGVAGDAQAFSSLYRSLYPAVYRFVARRVRSPRDREDLVAQVFHRMLEALPRYDAARCSVRGWVLTITRNLVIDHLRAARSARVDSSVELLADALPGHAHAHPEQSFVAVELEDRLRRALDALPLRTRQVLALRLGDGLSHAEIAEVLDLTLVNVKQIASRGLRSLKDAIADTDSALAAAREVDYATG